VDYLYRRLLDADPNEVPVICDTLAPHKDALLEKLWAVVETPEKGKESQRLRAASALAKYDPEGQPWDKFSKSVVDQLVAQNPVFLGLWIEAFRPVKGKLLPSLAKTYRDTSTRESDRTLATNILADYAANQPPFLADLLMDADEGQFVVLFSKLKVLGELGLPFMKTEIAKQTPFESQLIYEEPRAIDKHSPKFEISNELSFPANLKEIELAAGKTYYLAMRSKDLISMLVLQDPTGKTLAGGLESIGNPDASLVYTPPTDGKYRLWAVSYDGTGSFVLTVLRAPSENDKDTLARRQATAAVALLKMNQPAMVWQLLKHSTDPRVRSYLIHRFGPLGTDVSAIVTRLRAETDVTIRRALILSLGEFGEKEFAPDERARMLTMLQEIFRTESDPGLHASAEWLLRQWKQDEWLNKVAKEWANDKDHRDKRIGRIKQDLKKANILASGPNERSRWYVNEQGQTMVVIPGPVEVMMGSLPTEENREQGVYLPQHKKEFGRTFAIAAKAVTVQEFQLFEKRHLFIPRYAPEPECPVVGITWHQAGAYCNWLSEQEGIPPSQWCYEMHPQIPHKVTKLKEKYLSLTGYRLPTEAEMEFAIRAGAVTSRHYGESEELLGNYAWCLQNSRERSWPVGTKKPNDLGLFDMHGNVWCWCQDSKQEYPLAQSGKAFEDTESRLPITDEEVRVLRGGSFKLGAEFVRSYYRIGVSPTTNINDQGFRPARTITAE
jgi:formylglycine-generating enzyme required for sulfatase activity